jgi:hypothetical protein
MVTDADFANLKRQVDSITWKLRLVDPSSTRGLSVTNIIGAVGFANIANNELPAGAINGVNTVFTLAFTPIAPGILLVAVNGAVKVQGVDYTLVGQTITFTVAPPVGAVISVLYLK